MTTLVRPSLRWLIELHLEGSFPLYLTNDLLTTARLGAGPELVSTVDVAPNVAPPGLAWQAEIASETPIIWFKLSEEPDALNVVNSGSAGGSAVQVVAADEVEVRSPVLASPEGRLYDRIYTTTNCSVDVGSGAYLRSITLAIRGKGVQWVRTLVASNATNEPSVAIPFSVPSGDVLIATFHSTDGNSVTRITDGSNLWLPVLGLATMDCWYAFMGGGLTAGNFLTVTWQFPPSINSQLLIDQFTGGMDGTVDGWYRPDQIVQSSAAVETASTPVGMFTGGNVTPVTYPSLIYFSIGTNGATIPAAGGWSNGLIATSVVSAGSGPGPPKVGGAYRIMAEPGTYANGVRRITTTAVDPAPGFTMMCWMKCESVGVLRHIFRVNFAASRYASIMVDSLGLLNFGFDSLLDSLSTGIFIADGFWHFVVAVVDHPVAGDLRASLYVDGASVGTIVYPLTSVASPSSVEFGPSGVALDELVIIPGPIELDRIVELYLAGLREGSLKPATETPIAAIMADNPRSWYRMNDGPGAKGFADSSKKPFGDWATEVGVLSPSLWYRLDEPYGTGTYYNSGSKVGWDLRGVVLGVPGSLDPGALLFDSNGGRWWPASEYIQSQINVSGLTYSEKMTVAFWVNVSVAGSPTAGQGLLTFAGSGGKSVNVYWPTTLSGQLGFEVTDGTHTGSTVGVTIPTGNWHFVAFTLASLTATSQVLLTSYLDGVLVAANTYAYTPWTSATTTITLQGQYGLKLDEILVWDGQALDVSLIMGLFIAGQGSGRPLLPTPFAPVGGAQVPGALIGDSDPAHNVMVGVQSPRDAAGNVGGMYQLRDGSTIEAWIRKATVPAQVLLSASNGTDAFPQMEFTATGVRGTFAAVSNAPVNVYDGEWHHVAVALRPVGTQAKLELYVDGIRKDSDLCTGLGTDTATLGVQYSIGFGAGGSAYATAVAADAPKLWWKLNEASAATTFANSGSLSGNALGHAGSGDVQDTGNNILDAGNFARKFTGAFAAAQVLGNITGTAISTAYTITAWLKPGTITTPTSGIAFELTTGTVPKTTISLKWNTTVSSGRCVEVAFADGTNPARSDIYALGGVAGDWHFVAVTYQFTVGMITIQTYVDGYFLGAKVYTASFPWQAFSVCTITGGQNSVLDELCYYEKKLASERIEAQWKAASEHGIELDEVAFFSPVLSPQRIAAHARAGRWMTNRLYQSRAREGATLQFASPTETGGIVASQQVSLMLPNTDGYWNQWFNKEVRGKLVHVHLLDEYTQEIQEFLFTGEISVWNYARGNVEVICESIAAQKLASAVPGLFLPAITTEGDPLSNSVLGPARAVSLGMGVGSGVPGMLAKQQGPNNLDPPEWDYVFGRGNLGISGITVNGTRSDDRTIWKYKARLYQPGGIYCTAIRFGLGSTDTEGNPWGGANIVIADVQRSYPDWDDFVMYEWKWLLGASGIGFFDDVHELVVTTPTPGSYTNPLTSAALTTGPSGLGLGGINLTAKDGDFLESVSAVSIPYDPFTVELWIKPNATGHMGTLPALLVCPRATSATTAWQIMYDVATKKVQWEEIETSIKSVVASVAVPDGVWSQVVFARAKLADESISLKVYLNGKLISVNPSPPLVYSTTPYGYRFFDYPGNGRAHRFSGVFGWCRISATERDARYVQKAYWFMRRNFIEFLREIIEIDVGDFVNDQSFIAAAQIVNDIPSLDAGMLCCDGWITQPVDAQTVIVALSRMRDFRLMRDRTGAIAIEVVQPGAIRQMTLSAGPPENNIVSVERLVKFSLSEAISGMPMMYRQARDSSGQLTGYDGRAWAEVLPVGRTGEVFELPFVFSHRTADIIRDFTANRLRLRDGAVTLTADHSARYLRPGHVVKLNLPTLVGYQHDVEVVSSSMQGYQNDITVVGYDETPFIYVPNPDLPKDLEPFEIVLPATKPILRATDAHGADWALYQSGFPRGNPFMVWVNPEELFLWDILIGDVEALPPITYVMNDGVWTVAGTASQVEALTTAGDSKYVACATAGSFRCQTADPMKVTQEVAAVVFEAVFSYTGSSMVYDTHGAFGTFYSNITMQTVLQASADISNQTVVGQCTYFPANGPFTNQTVTGLISFVPQKNFGDGSGPYIPINFNRARTLKIGMRSSLANVRCDQIRKYIYPKITEHKYFGFARIWRNQTRVWPAATDIPYKTVPYLYGIQDGGPDDPWPGFTGLATFWYYYVRVYDILSREIGSYGPLTVCVDLSKPIDTLREE